MGVAHHELGVAAQLVSQLLGVSAHWSGERVFPGNQVRGQGADALNKAARDRVASTQANKPTAQILSQVVYSFNRSPQDLKEPVSQNLRVGPSRLLGFRFSQLEGCRPLQVKCLRQASLVPMHNVVTEL